MRRLALAMLVVALVSTLLAFLVTFAGTVIWFRGYEPAALLVLRGWATTLLGCAASWAALAVLDRR